MDQDIPSGSEKTCKNCWSPVAGKTYCPSCGQKSDTHILSFRELLEELADGLFNMDSRVWRSLLPLALHPGKLTNEYLAGKRMLYLPPFRLYLILSLLFFLFSGNNINLGEDFNQDSNQIITASNIPELNLEQLNDDEQSNEENNLTTAEQCTLSGLPRDAILSVVIRNACLMLREDSERFFDQMEDSIPVMMLVGIPLVALIMQLFYALSGRNYVEHIVFLFHAHAFYFLISFFMTITSWLGQAYGFLFSIMDWIRIVAGFYIPVYIYLAMKNVYGDSGLKTFAKAIFLLLGYGLCIGIVMMTGALITALTL